MIEIYKFRSMYVDSLDQTASKLVTRGDPRVTRVGRFIRKTSLDELPQLFNVVLQGQPLTGRAAAACGPRQGRRPAIRRRRGRLFRTPQGASGHYRLGSGQRVAR